MKKDFQPTKCAHCGQSETYLLPIDRGTVDILKAIAVAILRKGINVIHPRKEMEISGREIEYKEMVTAGVLTSNQVGNLSRPRAHGFIAPVKGSAGNYQLTKKAIEFLRGGEVPRFAVLSKVEKKQIGYWEPEQYLCTIKDFKPDQEYWTGCGYDIVEGRVVRALPIPVPKKLPVTGSLF